MECPHCSQDTDPTLVYCKVCGEQIELDPEQVHKALERDSERDAIEMMEEQSRVAIYVTLFLLVSVFALRLVLLRPVVGDVGTGYFAPARVVEEKHLDPNPLIEIEPLVIEVPDEQQVEDYKKRKTQK